MNVRHDRATSICCRPRAKDDHQRQRISTDSPFERQIGYSRAVAVEQAEQCPRTIDAALREAGCSIDDVVRVRYLPVLRRWFSAAMPAATTMQVSLMDPAMTIEIEVTAARSQDS